MKPYNANIWGHAQQRPDLGGHAFQIPTTLGGTPNYAQIRRVRCSNYVRRAGAQSTPGTAYRRWMRTRLFVCLYA